MWRPLAQVEGRRASADGAAEEALQLLAHDVAEPGEGEVGGTRAAVVVDHLGQRLLEHSRRSEQEHRCGRRGPCRRTRPTAPRRGPHRARTARRPDRRRPAGRRFGGGQWCRTRRSTPPPARPRTCPLNCPRGPLPRTVPSAAPTPPGTAVPDGSAQAIQPPVSDQPGRQRVRCPSGREGAERDAVAAAEAGAPPERQSRFHVQRDGGLPARPSGIDVGVDLPGGVGGAPPGSLGGGDHGRHLVAHRGRSRARGGHDVGDLVAGQVQVHDQRPELLEQRRHGDGQLGRGPILRVGQIHHVVAHARREQLRYQEERSRRTRARPTPFPFTRRR